MEFLKLLSLNKAACWYFVRWSIEIINNISFLNCNVEGERITMIILKRIMSLCLETKLNAFMQTNVRQVTAVVGICLLSKHWHSDCFLPGIFCDLEPCEASNPCENGAVCGEKMDLEISPLRYQCPCGKGFAGPHCEIHVSECSSSPCLHGHCYDSEFTQPQQFL